MLSPVWEGDSMKKTQQFSKSQKMIPAVSEWSSAHLSEAIEKIRHAEAPVILLEGVRKLPDQARPSLVSFSIKLANLIPNAKFRTGNESGSDEVFSEGIKKINPGRLQYVLPYRQMRRSNIHPQSEILTLEDIPASEEQTLFDQTINATPAYKGLINLYAKSRKRNKYTVRAFYLLRDTLKVIGSQSLGLSPASLGIFYTDPVNPLKGGTGHTIRVCNQNKAPVFYQETWMMWIENGTG